IPSPAVVDGVQARPCRPKDDRGLRPPGAKPGTAAAAVDPDRRGYSGGRARSLERVEADLASNSVRGSGGTAPARPQAARPKRTGRGAAGRARRAAGMESER